MPFFFFLIFFLLFLYLLLFQYTPDILDGKFLNKDYPSSKKEKEMQMPFAHCLNT